MTFGSDLTSQINSDPAWKVATGYRSSSRRPKKLVDKSLKKCEGLVCKGLEDSIMPVSEAEKQGVSAVGCRFSKKAEHVPIKKRRFLFRSPSPPPVEETLVTTKTQDDSDKHSSLNTASDVNSSHIFDGKCAKKCDNPRGIFGQDEDFSGISILAAAACSSSLGRECGYAESGSGVENSLVLQGPCESSTNLEAGSTFKGPSKEEFFNSSEVSTGGTYSCISTEPVGELAWTLTAVPCSEDVKGIGQGTKNASLGPDSVTSSGDTSCCKIEELVDNRRPSSWDGRLHWDLNVVMDAWEEPSNDSDVHSGMPQNKCHGGGEDNFDNKKLREHDLQDDLTRTCAEQTFLITNEQKALTDHASFSKNKMDRDIGLHVNVAQHDGLAEHSALSNTYSNLDVSKCDASDHTEPSASTFGTDNASVNNLKCNKHLCDPPVTEDSGSRDIILSVKHEIYVASSLEVQTESGQNVDIKAFPNSDTSGEVSNILSAPSDVGVFQGGDLTGHNATMRNISEVPSKTCKESHDSHLGKRLDSNVPERNDCAKIAEGEDDLGAQGDGKAVAGTDRAAEFQEGYDSQYEDGELRESNERACDEYEDMYGEAENVDYGSDNMELSVFNPSDHHNSENGEVEGIKNGRLGVDDVGSSFDCIIANDVNPASEALEDDIVLDIRINRDCQTGEKMKVPTGEKLRDSGKNSSDMAAVHIKDNTARRENLHADVNELVDANGTETREEPKAFRKPLQSRIEASGVCHDEQLNRFDNRFECGPMRSFDRGRYSFHNQIRGRPGGNWDGPSDNRRCRRHYSPINFRRLKVDDESEGRDEAECDGNQDDLSYIPHLPSNNRHGDDEVPCSGLQSRYRYDRKFSPDRAGGYGRGRRYGPSMGSGAGRGRERYNGPSQDESFQSLLKHRRPLSHRERSLSPFGGRRQSHIHHLRGKSPSQSRSRSPVRWNSPRGRPESGASTFIRQHSRSPNFRSEFRMQRLRSPNQQPGLGSDHVAGFRSTTRTHNSPPNRWNSGQRNEMGPFREFRYRQRTTILERSPGGSRSRDDRDSAIDSAWNLKSEGHYRVSDRISEDGAGRRYRHEENYEDRRKPFLRPVRRNYEDGMASRSHHDNDDGFPVAGNMRDRDASSFRGRGGFRNIDRRMGDTRRFRGEQQSSFAYETEGKFNSDSKQFGVGVMASTRILKSEEQYRSYHTGRYNNMDGATRVHRSDVFEERRKQYGSTNLMMRYDDQGTEEEQNHEAGDNSQNPADFGGRDARGLDGRIGTLSTSREARNPDICGPEDKLDYNTQTDVLQKVDDNGAKETIPS